MAETAPPAFPFIEVKIDTTGLAPVSQRAPGVVAVVGESGAGDADANKPYLVDDHESVKTRFGDESEKLARSLKLALGQDPKPSKIYGVKIDSGDFDAGLGALEASDDVTFVSLANVTDTTILGKLKTHVESMSDDGQKRIGVAMVNPATQKSSNYVTDVKTALAGLKDTKHARMILVAARGAKVKPEESVFADVATASMAAIAGYEPHISTVLRMVGGFKMPAEAQFSPSEIKGLSSENIIPVIDPALIPGESMHFAEGRVFTGNESLLWVDIVRTLDDIEYRLKAGLIGMVGDARITKNGLIRIKSRVEGILGPLESDGVIDGFSIRIPVLDILSIPEASRTTTDNASVTKARQTRTVDLLVEITYGPAVHHLLVTLAPKF